MKIESWWSMRFILSSVSTSAYTALRLHSPSRVQHQPLCHHNSNKVTIVTMRKSSTTATATTRNKASNKVNEGGEDSSLLSSSSCLFVYGTLMAPPVMEMLVGRIPPWVEAQLHGYQRFPVRNQMYPGMIPMSSNYNSSSVGKSINGGDHNNGDHACSVCGILYMDLTPYEWRRLDWFEGSEYTRRTVPVCISRKPSSSFKNHETNTSLSSMPSKMKSTLSMDDTPWSTKSTTGDGTSSASCGKKQQDSDDDADDDDQEAYTLEAQVYEWTHTLTDLINTEEWSYDHFISHHLQDYIRTTVQPCKEDMDRRGL